MSFANTYAEYYYRCGAGSDDWLWTSGKGTGEDLEDYLRLSTCYTRFDCVDVNEGYYYEDHKLECGWGISREWPEAIMGPL